MSDLWGVVPQVRWTGERVEPPAQPEPTEPSVSANVAATLENPQVETSASIAESGTKISAIDSRQAQPVDASSVQPAAASRQPVLNSRNLENSSFSSTHSSASPKGQAAETTDSPISPAEVERQVSGNPHVALADPAQDQIERLKAALDDDALRAKESPRQAGGSPDVRVRVDSMLDSARRLFDLGRLREAHHTAKSAHDLGDSARLDYSPDEERPIDLVQRIDDRMKESAEQSDLTTPNANTPTSAPTAARSDPNAPSLSLEKPAPSASSDVSSSPIDAAPKARRDWGYGLNVFRRDRKAVTSDSSTSTLAATPAPESDAAARDLATESTPAVVQLDLEVDAESPGTTDAAVVRANRSLTLIKGQEKANAGVERQPRNDSAPIAYVPTLPNSDLDELTDPSLASASDRGGDTAETLSELNSTIWPPEAIESTPRRILDDSAPPPDFDEVSPLSPFRDVASPSTPAMTEPARIVHARPANQTWHFGCCAFGVCALVAFFWYRRGAT